MLYMKEIKVCFDEADLVVLNHQAAAAGVSRSELIRKRALVLNCNNGLSIVDYHRLISDATAYLRGDMPRRMVELLTAFVITWIASKSPNAKDQSSTD